MNMAGASNTSVKTPHSSRVKGVAWHSSALLHNLSRATKLFFPGDFLRLCKGQQKSHLVQKKQVILRINDQCVAILHLI